MFYSAGYGMSVVMGIYLLSFLSISKIIPMNASRPQQIFFICITCILSTGINYIIAKALNKRKSMCKILGVKLENVVLSIGVFLLVSIAMISIL